MRPGGRRERRRPPKRADAAAVLRAWRDGLELVPLDGGGWAPLPADWLARTGTSWPTCWPPAAPTRRLAPAALPTAGRPLRRPRAAASARSSRASRRSSRGSSASRARRCRPGSRPTLRAYQQQGVDWLVVPARRRSSARVLADDMGLGKTLQTICVLRGRALVVCPKSVVYNWADEIAPLPPGPAHGHLPRARGASSTPTADVTLTTYAVLRLDASAARAGGVGHRRARRGAGHQEPRAARRRAPPSSCGASSASRSAARRSRTGSKSSGARCTSRTRACSAARATSRSATPAPSPDGDPDAAARLRAKIRPFVLRRTKREVVPELPPRTDTCSTSSSTRSSAASTTPSASPRKQAVADRLAQGGGVLAALEALLRLRQAACHAALVPGQHADVVVEGRATARGARGRGGRGPQGARLLAVDVAARSGRAAPARGRASASRASTARRAIAAPWCASSRTTRARR